MGGVKAFIHKYFSMNAGKKTSMCDAKKIKVTYRILQITTIVWFIIISERDETMNEIIKFEQYTKERRSACMCEILKKIQGKTAEELLEIYGTKSEGAIDIYKLLQNIGISVRAIDFGEIEEDIGYQKGDILGATLIDGEEVGIFCRTGTTENRRRFTIAHELAHCCIHTDSLKETNIQLRQESEKDNLTEIDANVFAGELLVPQGLLMKYYEKLICPSLSSLAQLFEVSTSVMAARLDYLKLSYYKDAELCVG